jgi:tRNA (Thr-GGU) A37 N-methylase
MAENFKLVSIVPVKTRQGTDPQKTFGVAVKTIDLVVGKPVADIKTGK